MKSTTSTKMLIFSLAFVATSYFTASPVDDEIFDLPLDEQTQPAQDLVQAGISAAAEEMRDAISDINKPASSSWFAFGGNAKKSLDITTGRTFPAWYYLTALLNHLHEHGHVVEQLGKCLNLPNENPNKSGAFQWADDLAASGQPSVIYAFTDYLVQCFQKNPTLMDQATQDSVIDLALLGLTSVTCASRGCEKTADHEAATKALRSFYVSKLKKVLNEKTVDQERFCNVNEIIEKNKEYWQAVSPAWLKALSVGADGKPAFGKEEVPAVDMTQSELISSSAPEWSEGDLMKALKCVYENLNTWLAQK